MNRLKNAFTLVELILVIVIFGIIAAIGADIFVKIYDNYILSRTLNNLETKTELTLEQIARRLQYRIKESVIGSKNANGVSVPDDYDALVNTDENYPNLEWIAYSPESFDAGGWSGFIDLRSGHTARLGTKITLDSPGSEMNTTLTVFDALSPSTIAWGSSNTGALIMDGYVGDFNITEYGWHNTDVNSSHRYTLNIDSAPVSDRIVIETNDLNGTEVYEHYKLAWSAYALVPVGTDCNDTDPTKLDCKLYLYYDYRPWNSQVFTDGHRALIAEYVSTFRFTQMGDVVRIKLCLGETLYDDNISVCKEKVVF